MKLDEGIPATVMGSIATLWWCGEDSALCQDHD